MPKPLPPHPNVRNCTHIKVTGQRCGSPALRGEFFCYFHTRVIKGVPLRVDMQLHSMALLEDCESIQLSIMHVVDGLIKGTLDPTRARLIIQALRIAARNAKNVRFDDFHYGFSEQPMVREVPDYARQYLIEHPEFGPPIESGASPSQCGAGAPAREEASPCGADIPAREEASPCSADTPVREAAKSVAPRESNAEPQSAEQNATQKTATTHPAAERRKNTAHSASRGTTAENDPAPKERKTDPSDNIEDSKEYELIQQAEAAIPGAMAGNWRDLRTVFEFAGIAEESKAP
jgi:hypothetical protein